MTSVAFSPGGDFVVSGSRDNTVRVWDGAMGDCLDVIPGHGDVQAIAAGLPQFPLRALSQGEETLVERVDSRQPVAFFPVSLKRITTHPNGRTWAGVSGRHLYIITLEGDPSAPPTEPPEQQ